MFMRREKGSWRLSAAATLLLAMGLALAACTGGGGGAGNAPPSAAPETPAENALEDGKLSAQPITFKWLASDRREAPIRNDWPTFQRIFDRTNVKIEFEPVPDGIQEKRQILIATNSVTDFMPVPHTDARIYGPEGVFLNLNDYLDIAPNIKKFIEEHPEAVAQSTGPDGGLYSIPVREGLGFNYSWIVRQDVMDELGLEAPTNPEEFYQMLKAMKAKYPDLYPLVSERGQFNGADQVFTALLRAFSGLEGYLPLDPKTGEYVFAPDHPGFKETLLYMNKLHAEALLDPEFAIITSAQWEERMLSGKSFVTWFWKTRVQMFNDTAAGSGMIPGYDVNVIPQFAAEGVDVYQYSRAVYSGNGIAISGKVSNKEVAVRFLDYLLSPEGSDYLALGIEGETYDRSEGEPKFLESLGPGPYSFLRGDYGVWYPDINLDMGKSRLAERLSERAQQIEEIYMPIVVQAPGALILNDEENELQKELLNNLTVYMDQKIAEFIAGRTPINDDTLQAFLKQCIDLGAYELRDMYNVAHQRAYGGS